MSDEFKLFNLRVALVSFSSAPNLRTWSLSFCREDNAVCYHGGQVGATENSHPVQRLELECVPYKAQDLVVTHTREITTRQRKGPSQECWKTIELPIMYTRLLTDVPSNKGKSSGSKEKSATLSRDSL